MSASRIRQYKVETLPNGFVRVDNLVSGLVNVYETELQGTFLNVVKRSGNMPALPSDVMEEVFNRFLLNA